MGTGPLLESKLHAPGRRPGSVTRERLEARFRPAQLTLVSAPAGFGKTTLLTQWLDRQQHVAWVALDERDDDPATFWSYVVAALQRATSSQVGADTVALLGSGVEPALTSVLNDLADHDVVLVLDDLHLVGSAAVHDGLAFMVEHLPPSVRLVVATRVDPPLPLARLRARGELVELRAADLRFTRDEASAYLTGSMDLTLTEPDVAVLADRTEGWAAALQLAGLSLRDRADVTTFLAGFAGTDRYVVDYLAEEVLARLPHDVREFLLATSVLERLTGPLCDAVTSRDGGAARLVELDRANLFVVPLDDRREWYRYHHLFADVLRAHLGEQHPELVADLHRRAAEWLHVHGDPADAVRHALAAGDVERAADLMELSWSVMSRQRREPEMARWRQAVPAEVLARRPVLAVAFVGALAQVGDFGSVARRLDDVEQVLASASDALVVLDQQAYASLPAQVRVYRAALALSHGDPAGTARLAREALDLAGPDDDLVRAAAGALGGLAAWSLGDLAAAHAAYTAAVAGLTSIGFVADVLGCTVTLGDLCRTQGRLEDAVRTYRGALDLAAAQPGDGPLRGTADMHVGLAGVLLERDDVAGTAEHLATSERLGDAKGLPQNAYRWRVVAARLRAAGGDLDAALALLDEAERVYDGDYSPDVQPVASVRARLLVRRGELDRAAAWAAERQLSASDDLTYLREHEHLTLARLLLARGDRPAAVALLERLLVAAEDGGRHGTVLEDLVLLALARDGDAALDTLHRAVVLAQPEGYVRVFADEGPPMAALLRSLLRREPALGYVRRLVAAALRSGEDRRPEQAELVEPLSDRELDVLRLLATDLDGPDIARELHVSLNTMRTHSKAIFRKLQVTNRRAAVSAALALDLLSRQRER